MAFKPKILNRITVRQLKMRLNRPYYIRIEKELYMGEILPKATIDKAPTLTSVFNFEDNEIQDMVCNAIFVNKLHKSYPEHNYVGKSFEVVMYNSDDPAKKYKLFSIAEIAEPTYEDFHPVDNTPANVDIETGEIRENTFDDEFDGETPEEIIVPAVEPEPEAVTRAKTKKSSRGDYAR